MKSSKNTIKDFFGNLRRKRLDRYKRKLEQQEKIHKLKDRVHKSSHSLLWVWEFSKKAVLICFIFYVIVQVYAMYMMYAFMDLSYLGELITETSQIVQNCVFAYLIKAGLENIGKIWFSRGGNNFSSQEPPEIYPDEPENSGDPDEPVG